MLSEGTSVSTVGSGVGTGVLVGAGEAVAVGSAEGAGASGLRSGLGIGVAEGKRDSAEYVGSGGSSSSGAEPHALIKNNSTIARDNDRSFCILIFINISLSCNLLSL